MTFSFCLFLFVLLHGSAPAQWYSGEPAPASNPTPTPAGTPIHPRRWTDAAPSSTPLPKPTPVKPRSPVIGTPAPHPTPATKSKRKIYNSSEGPAEKTIAVDPKVSISLCVTSGTLKVNGWGRSELRAFVDGGSSLGFKALPLGMQNKKPARVQILGFDPQKYKDLDVDECLEGDVELDVPLEASISVKSKETDITIDSIGTARVDNLSGSLILRNIKNGAEAANFEGNLTAESINGRVNLSTSTGQIVVFRSSPYGLNDTFRAKSRSGAISLQGVEHNDVDVSSATGSLRFTGKLEEAGDYKFTTTSGLIVLSLPMDTSCRLTATYGGNGEFETQIPFKDIHKYDQSGTRRIVALMGTGESSLTVTTYNASILIKSNKK